MAGIYSSAYDFDPNEAKVPDYLRRKWHPTDLLPESLSEPLASWRDKIQTGGSKLGFGKKVYTDPNQARIGPDETEGTVQKLLNQWELPLVGKAGDFARSEVEEEMLGPVFKLGAKAAGMLPVGMFRQATEKLGDLLNTRFNPDTSDLERAMARIQGAGPDSLIYDFTRVAANPSGRKKLETILDLGATRNAPDADIEDEIARRMAIWSNQPAPPRKGAFPGLAITDHPELPGQGLPTVEEIAGGPVTELGRFDLGGINPKRVLEGPQGRWLEKGGPNSFDWSGKRMSAAENPRDSAREEAHTKITSLLGGNTPIAHRVQGGGTIQPFLPPSYVNWHKAQKNPKLKSPEIANALAEEQARDVFGAITDRHTGQFMFDPDAGRIAGVDKGYSDLDRMGLRGVLMPPEAMHVPGVGMYDELTPSGKFGGMVDPNSFQRVAALGLQVPEADWKAILDPYMEHNWMRSDADKAAGLRNFMQSIQGMPQHLDKYYRTYIKP